MLISRDMLEQGQVLYQQTINADNLAVRDPVITAFAMAMRISGYEVATNNECSVLRSCPICPVGKGNYSTKYIKDSMVVWGCPHCQSITE